MSNTHKHILLAACKPLRLPHFAYEQDQVETGATFEWCDATNGADAMTKVQQEHPDWEVILRYIAD